MSALLFPIVVFLLVLAAMYLVFALLIVLLKMLCVAAALFITWVFMKEK